MLDGSALMIRRLEIATAGPTRRTRLEFTVIHTRSGVLEAEPIAAAVHAVLHLQWRCDAKSGEQFRRDIRRAEVTEFVRIAPVPLVKCDESSDHRIGSRFGRTCVIALTRRRTPAHCDHY